MEDHVRDAENITFCGALGSDVTMMIAARIGDGTVSEITDAIHIHPALKKSSNEPATTCEYRVQQRSKRSMEYL